METFFYYLATMIASYFIQQALTKKPEPPKAANFEDFSFPQADEGTAQCVIFGDVWTGGWMVLSYGNYRTEAIKSGGGKK